MSHIVATTIRYADDAVGYDETKTRTLLIRANRRETKFGLARKNRAGIVKALQSVGELQPNGCDCTHCRNDWDCCGNYVVSHHTFQRVRRGFKITQHLNRNI